MWDDFDRMIYSFCPLRNDYCLIDCVCATRDVDGKIYCSHFHISFPECMLIERKKEVEG